MRRIGIRWFAFSALVIALLAFVSVKDAASEGLVFGIKPGLSPVQSSYFGLDMNQFRPYVGLDFARVSFNLEEGGEDPSSSSGSAFVLVPHIGSRFYFSAKKKSGDVVPYVQGDLLFSIASVGGRGLSKQDKELAQDVLGLWGFTAAFGAEYYFSDRFSIGGEYGFRYFNDGVDYHRDEWRYNGSDYVTKEVTDKFNATFNISYVTLTLNFHL